MSNFAVNGEMRLRVRPLVCDQYSPSVAQGCARYAGYHDHPTPDYPLLGTVGGTP